MDHSNPSGIRTVLTVRYLSLTSLELKYIRNRITFTTFLAEGDAMMSQADEDSEPRLSV